MGDVHHTHGGIDLFPFHRIGRDAYTGHSLWADLETGDVRVGSPTNF